jgi:hypothetical protein
MVVDVAAYYTDRCRSTYGWLVLGFGFRDGYAKEVMGYM